MKNCDLDLEVGILLFIFIIVISGNRFMLHLESKSLEESQRDITMSRGKKQIIHHNYKK